MLPVRPAPMPAATRKRNSRTLTAVVRPPSVRSCPHQIEGRTANGATCAEFGPASGVIGHVRTADDDRQEPPADADERTLLVGWLEFHRATMARKCAGLSDEALRRCAIPPSTLSLIGLVRHLTEIERLYIRHGFAGEQISPLQYVSDEEPDGDFDL